MSPRVLIPLLALACVPEEGVVRNVPPGPGWTVLTRPPDDTAEPSDDTDPPEEEPLPTELEACYLGSSRGGDTCLELVELDPTPAEYVYPAPYQGNVNYRAPEAYLDLQVTDPSTALAPNFVLSELASVTKGRYAVVQPALIDHLQAMRDELGPLQVNSGYRSPSYNAGIDGATYSRHMYGDAADLAPLAASLSALQAACGDEQAGYVQVYVSHVHCDWRDEPVSEAFYGPSQRSAALGAHPEVRAWLEDDGPWLRAPTEGFDEGEPLRVWYAFDASGDLLERAVAEEYLPPLGTASVEVEVGGLFLLSTPR